MEKQIKRIDSFIAFVGIMVMFAVLIDTNNNGELEPVVFTILGLVIYSLVKLIWYAWKE